MCTTLHDIFQESQVVDTENEKSETREKHDNIRKNSDNWKLC